MSSLEHSLDISRVKAIESLGDVWFTGEVYEPHKRHGIADRTDSPEDWNIRRPTIFVQV
jgi:hypothetical protein